jgi:hypothetical protein
MRRFGPLLLLITMAPPSQAATIGCMGDCDGNGNVTVAELVLSVSLVLGKARSASCSPFGEEQAGVAELMRAVQNALAGCPPAATATVTVTPTATQVPTVTPTVIADPVLRVLTQIIEEECVFTGPIYSREVTGADGDYSFECQPGPGHVTRGSLRRHLTPAAAAAALEQQAPSDGRRISFHDLPAVAWERDDPLINISDTPEYHGILWVAGCWLIDIDAFDDTHFWLAPPEAISEAIFERAVEPGLIGACPGE